MHLAELEAAHATLLARLPDARARLEAAVVELRHALTGVEALARLTGCSDGHALAIFIPPVAGGPDHTFVVSTSDMLAAMTRIGNIEAVPVRTAKILRFPR